MANDTSSASEEPLANRLRTVEQVFRALPPLGSPQYIEHISSATARELPPEVLARALRQLPTNSAGFDATWARLTRRQGKRWEYFLPVTAQARRMAVGVHDHEDVMQDAFRRILETLPTERGDLAERAWHSFCRREATEAWRDRFGRRGERVPREDAVEIGQLTEAEGGEKPSEEVFDIEDLPPWHVVIHNDNSERIERMARKVVKAIPDEFVREVASRAWFSDVPVKLSGTPKPETLILTEVFTGKSRHQIQRALRQAKTQLAAALLAEEDVEWSSEIQALLEFEKGGAPKKTTRKEKTQ